MLLWFTYVILLLVNAIGISSISIRRNIGENSTNQTTIQVPKSNTTNVLSGSQRKFQICEQFSESNDSFGLHIHGNGITVVSRLSA